MKSKFEEKIASLNQEQLRAVQTTEGPVMVVAGPGTGKTHVLTLRIAEIIRQGTSPHNILALTFTDNAAQNMKNRLIELIGAEAYPVQISTFHAFCQGVITLHPEAFDFDPRGAVVTDLEKLQIVRELLDELPIRALKPKKRFDSNAGTILSYISKLKREGVNSESFAELVAKQSVDLTEPFDESDQLEIKIRKDQVLLQELQSLYSAYENRLVAAGRYDYDDMIISVMDSFETNTELLREYQEMYQYILVDEYQDTNTAQNHVVHLLASYWGEQANIFVVGDPHQSIMRFQGASLHNSLEFLRWYPAAEVITLVEGYRCPPEIYELSHNSILSTALLQEKDLLGPKLLTALTTPLRSQQAADAHSIIYMRSVTREEQFALIAQEIKSLLSSGVEAGEIAVLFPVNATGEELGEYLAEVKIPYVSTKDRSALDSPIVQQFVEYLVLLYTASKGKELSEQTFSVFSYPWVGVDPTILFKIGREAGRLNQPVWDVLANVREWSSGDPLTEEDTRYLAVARQKQNLIMQLASFEATNGVLDWIRQVLDESGLKDFIFNPQCIKENPDFIIAIKSFLNFVKENSEAALNPWRLHDVLEAVEIIKAQNMGLPFPQIADAGVVTLSTVHKAKGMEWNHVFVVDLVDKKWGNRSARRTLPFPEGIVQGVGEDSALDEKIRNNDDDRRLFYVATTRARKQLHLHNYLTQESRGKSSPVNTSMFLAEVKSLTETPVKPTADIVNRVEISAPRSTYVTDRLEKYLTDIFDTFSVSVTALNAYLQDPRQFLINNLLQLPGKMNQYQVVGNVIHKLVEEWMSLADRTSGKIQDALIQQAKDKAAHDLREMSDLRDRERWEEDVAMMARAYMDATKDEPVPDIFATEYVIGKGRRSAVVRGIAINGRIDSLQWRTPEHTSLIAVDYKTGHIYSDGDIRGTTKAMKDRLSARELILPEAIRTPYARQLLFYKLLGRLDSSIPAPIELGVLDFVEGPSNVKYNKVVRRTTELRDEDVALLEELIVATVAEMKTLAFVDEVLNEGYNSLPQAAQEK